VRKIFLESVLCDAATYIEHARRKTVTAMDVAHALKRQGHALYGLGQRAICIASQHTLPRTTPQHCTALLLPPPVLLSTTTLGKQFIVLHAPLHTVFVVASSIAFTLQLSYSELLDQMLSPPGIDCIILRFTLYIGGSNMGTPNAQPCFPFVECITMDVSVCVIPKYNAVHRYKWVGLGPCMYLQQAAVRRPK